MGRLAAAAILVAVLTPPALAQTSGKPDAPPATPASSHPYFNDRGALAWSTKLADAQEAARRDGKLILIEFGRQKCGNCRSFVERVVPDPRIRPRLSAIAVGLAAECDPPGRDSEVANLLGTYLTNAKTLPFVGIVTADLEWIAGYSGQKSAGLFIEQLAAAESSPLRPANADSRAKLAPLAERARAALAKGDHAGAVTAIHAADAYKGKCDERDALEAARAEAAAWAEERLAGAAATIAAKGDAEEAKRRLSSIAHDFAGEPAGADAKKGLDALARHATYAFARDAGDAAKLASVREKALAEFAGTRWKALFEE